MDVGDWMVLVWFAKDTTVCFCAGEEKGSSVGLLREHTKPPKRDTSEMSGETSWIFLEPPL